MTDIKTAEQMREAAARVAKSGWLDSRRHVIGDAERECELCEEIEAAIRAIPCAEDADVDAGKVDCGGCNGTGTGPFCDLGWCPVCEGFGVDELETLRAEVARLREALAAEAADAAAARKQLRELRAAMKGGKP